MEEFINEFEFLAAQIGQIPKKIFLSFFMKGLRNDILLRVRTLWPKNHLDAMRMSQCVEAEIVGVPSKALVPSRSWNSGSNWQGFKSNASRRDGSVEQTTPYARSNTEDGGFSSFVTSTSSSNMGTKMIEGFVLRDRGFRHMFEREVEEK
jgi:hypothetical protein